MRPLTIAECDFVSGGEVTQLTDVVVTGSPFEGPSWSTGGGGFYGGGGGHNWGSDSDRPREPSSETLPQCVTIKPGGIDEQWLLNVIRSLAQEISSYNDENNEYGALIYEWEGGIGSGVIGTYNSDERVPFSTQGIPDGARIIGMMHNHPDVAGRLDGRPSTHQGGDWDQRDDLINSTSLTRGITADPNLFHVIYSNEDNKSRIYDSNDKNTQSVSCAIPSA